MKLIEFYSTPQGEILLSRGGKTPVKITPSDIDLVNQLAEMIKERYPMAYDRLISNYKESAKNKPYFQWRIVRRFIACNMGNYDTQSYDIDNDGDFKMEEVKCPLRGECKDENVICKAKPLTLTARELQVLELITLQYSNAVIANVLDIAIETVKSHRRNMLEKLKMSNNNELVKYYMKYFK